MLNFPKDIKNARVMLSNDDSIHAHGFRILEECVNAVSDDVWVVAPESEQSAVGHSLTIHEPLRVKKYEDKRYTIYGTPTDCVMMGAKHIMRDKRPDLVVSGINHGRNVADDVTYSGTIAAAIEGTLIGIPSVAFSNEYDPDTGLYNWDTCRKIIPRVLKTLQGMSWPENVLINVNIPYVPEGQEPEIVVRRQGHYEVSMEDIIECTDPRGRPYYWIGPPAASRNVMDPETDVGALANKKVTITPLYLNLTHHPTLEQLEEIFPS